ncbi:MAG: right-handed parallel beta-helix repeat-containing protein [Phycisphaerales bacterium]|nr:right-handed parallel beta-helix repeat-containing protein [Planctomycetota bacterium]
MFKPCCMVALVCATLSGTAVADIINVPGDYPTIQAGINAAQNGDEVVVADGTYTGAGNRNVVFAGKAITLRSENGPTNCIIDCESLGRGFIFYELDTPATVVDGFTITNGLGHPGGAIYAYYFSSPTITNCIITGNTGDAGGGGGIYCAMCFATITNTIITGNTAIGDGGGVYTEGGDPTITNSLISGNTADSGGGGVYSNWGSPTITNSTIVGNTAGNVAGGSYFGGETSPTITNSILWGNGLEEIYVDESSTLVVSYSNVQGGWLGTGNIDDEPLFVDPTNDNYRLSSVSPGIDAGDNTAVPKGISTDLDGNPRFVEDPDTPNAGNGGPPIVDMGAYEFQVSECLWDLDHNGSVGILDLLALLAAWGPAPTPDPPDFDGDGMVGILDLLYLLANWGPCP